MPSHCFTDDVVCFGSSPYLFIPVILVQVTINFSLPKNTCEEVVWLFFFFLEKRNQALFAPCGEPSVFALMKYSLDCTLSQWHAYLLESVLLLLGCCEGVFLYHGEDLLIIESNVQLLMVPWKRGEVHINYYSLIFPPISIRIPSNENSEFKPIFII